MRPQRPTDRTVFDNVLYDPTMAIKLPFPSEPTRNELRQRSDWSEGMWSEQDIRDDRIAERQAPSYLWEQWRHRLNRGEYSWQQFQSELKMAIPAIQSWGLKEASWGEVLSWVEQALNVEIQR